jgi:hypothetical protein
MPTIATGRSPSVTGRWWMWCSVIRSAAGSSVVVGETAQAREGDDAIGHHDAAAGEQQLPGTRLDRVGARVNGDRNLLEQRADGGARLAPEQLQRLRLGRDERELDAGGAPVRQPGRRHQRQLIGGQAPDRARRAASTDSSSPGVKTAPASAASCARSKWRASPSLNGSATESGRYQKCVSGAESSTPTLSRRARAAPAPPRAQRRRRPRSRRSGGRPATLASLRRSSRVCDSRRPPSSPLFCKQAAENSATRKRATTTTAGKPHSQISTFRGWDAREQLRKSPVHRERDRE